MQVILKQDIPNLGYKNDIINVKTGYGRNFLIPKGYATLATETARKVHAENMKQRAHKEEKFKNDALAIAKQLEDSVLSIGAKTSTTGKIFGSVNTIQIAEAISKLGVAVDRRNIKIAGDVKEVGKYSATVKLHREVKIDMEFEVVAE